MCFKENDAWFAGSLRIGAKVRRTITTTGFAFKMIRCSRSIETEHQLQFQLITNKQKWLQ